MSSHIVPSVIQQIDPISKALVSLSSSALASLLTGIDEAVRREFTTLRNEYFTLLIVSTVLVFVGIVLEEGDEWVPYLKHVLPLSSITEYRLAKKLVKNGWIILIVGVMGEGILEALVSRTDGILNTFDNILITDARRQAGDAATSSKIAHDEADAVKTESDALKQELANLEVRAEQLRTAMADRVFDDPLAGQRLRKFSRVKVDIEWLARKSCSDCEQLAEEISIMLHDARWNASWPIPNRPRETFSDGVIVQGNCAVPIDVNERPSVTAKRVSDAADALVVELNKANITAITHPASCNAPNALLIRVGRSAGRRPLPPRERP